jgi:hypothetical protein
MVVLYPNQVAILRLLCNCFGEQKVSLTIGIPSAFVENDLAGVVMKEGP